jgi:hypothetical protein
MVLEECELQLTKGARRNLQMSHYCHVLSRDEHNKMVHKKLMLSSSHLRVHCLNPILGHKNEMQLSEY